MISDESQPSAELNEESPNGTAAEENGGQPEAQAEQPEAQAEAQPEAQAEQAPRRQRGARSGRTARAPRGPSTASARAAEESIPLESPPKPRLLEMYRTTIVPAIMQEFGFSNPMRVPRVQKIVLNIGLGEALTNSRAMEGATGDLTTETAVLALIVKPVYQSKENWVEIQPQRITFSAKGAGAALEYLEVIARSIPTEEESLIAESP